MRRAADAVGGDGVVQGGDDASVLVVRSERVKILRRTSRQWGPDDLVGGSWLLCSSREAH